MTIDGSCGGYQSPPMTHDEKTEDRVRSFEHRMAIARGNHDWELLVSLAREMADYVEGRAS